MSWKVYYNHHSESEVELSEFFAESDDIVPSFKIKIKIKIFNYLEFLLYIYIFFFIIFNLKNLYFIIIIDLPKYFSRFFISSFNDW